MLITNKQLKEVKLKLQMSNSSIAQIFLKHTH